MLLIIRKYTYKEREMSNDNLKNIVVLKNLPSNLVDEAIVVLKSKKTAKKLELVEKNSAICFKKTTNNNDYIIKEAENVVANYINKIEKGKSIKRASNNIEAKYKKIKAYSIFVSIILALCIIRSVF